MHTHTFEEIEQINHDNGECLAGCRLCRHELDRMRRRAFDEAIRQIVKRHFDHLEAR